MKIGFLYAGQGSQNVGMGQDLYDTYNEFKETFDNANPGFDIKDCCFNGPIEKLGQTRYTQPCMVAFAVGVTKILANNGIKVLYFRGATLKTINHPNVTEVRNWGDIYIEINKIASK